MGRSSLIAVLGFIVIFGMVRQNINKTSESSALNSSIFTETILARHVTNIAANYIMSIHSETGENNQEYSSDNFLDGSYNASITSLGYDSTLDFDTLQISVTGSYQDESHTTRVQFISKSILIPRITASIAVESDCTLFDFSGHPQIVGTDMLMDGSGENPDGTNLAGLTLSNSEDSIRFEAFYSDSTWIQGDPVVEVSSDSPLVSLSDLIAYYAQIADETYEGGTFSQDWGSEDNPIVVYSNGNFTLEGTSIGYGVLAINGSFTMRGSPTWYGLIIASGGESLIIDASVGNPTIYGALHIGATVTELELRGTANIFYSSEAIEMVRLDITNRGLDRRIITEMIWYE
ncbi:MAG: hypothetical protein IIA58_01050 [Candidatus Marinimicrobia bacterium]|nr:hypothetical protein [Candidatus Neomarinimicrobiota bacterium]